ncbi:hypothetical protein QA802_26365 [Streptomyces sp. B21-105]|uniref:hypothetical protein n=1 Tax=Streptomyces sp. B21-105 TaxID=3039417 RepID=UPI002FF07035
MSTYTSKASRGAAGAGTDEDDSHKADGDEDDGDEDDGDDEELRALIDRIGDGRAGPLREAVLHGIPCDGGEAVFLAAASVAGETPVVEVSLGSVRPMTPGALRTRGDVYALVLTALAGLVLPRRLAWRVTADREGMWFNGLRGTRHILWDDVRMVKADGARLRIESRRTAFGEWRVSSPRWAWLEARLGVLHPYERTAAEITAMWRTPALRPTGTATGRLRGRPLWPLGAAAATAVAAALLLLR